MNPSIVELTGLPPRPGAAPDIIDSIEKALSVKLPADYRAFLIESDGLEGFVGEHYLVLFGAGKIVHLNEIAETSEFAPGLVLIGGDGGGEGYGILGRQYVRVELIGMSLETVEFMGRTLVDLVRRVQSG